MFVLDVSQINWLTTVAHLPTENTQHRDPLHGRSTAAPRPALPN
jgi:hypothetical protein